MKKFTLFLIIIIAGTHAVSIASKSTADEVQQPQKKTQTKHTITNDTEFTITINALDKSKLPLFSTTIDPKKKLEKTFGELAPASYAIENVRNPKTNDFLTINKNVLLKNDEQKQEHLEIKIAGTLMVDLTIATIPTTQTAKK